MLRFFETMPGNFAACFGKRMLLWHGIAILLTAVCVVSGFDQGWFEATRAQALRTWMFPAVRIGWYLPVYLPLLLLVVGWVCLKPVALRAGWAIAQAEIIGGVVAAAYKAVTGRAHPPRTLDADLSHVFKFGFLRGGVFWGWPSSHTTIAFAMAVTVYTLFPKRRWLGCAALVYAFYIGTGVSLTIHWFSDFIAGAIFGSIVGAVVGRAFLSDNGPGLSRGGNRGATPENASGPPDNSQERPNSSR